MSDSLKRRLGNLGMTVLAAVAATPGLAQILPVPKPSEPMPTPDGAVVFPLPTAKGDGAASEQWIAMPNGRVVRNVTSPTLTMFAAAPGKANGAAIVVAPGGGFRVLAIEEEGVRVATWLAEHGITAFILKYRLQATPRDPGEFVRDMTQFLSAPPSPGTMATPPAALADAQAAVRMVRENAKAWSIDPKRVGFVGFSAGAMTALSVALAPEKDARPDFVAPIYGPMAAREIPAYAPPMFTALALDDPLMMREGDFSLINSYVKAGRPIEAHLFETGGHGFGLLQQGKSSDLWIEQFHSWLKSRGLVPRAN